LYVVLFIIIGALILTPFIVPGYKGSHKGCARVDFSRLEDATAAYQSSQAEPFYLMDRTLTVSYSHKTAGIKSRVLYFRDFKGNEADLREILREYKDQINGITFGECCLLSK
jgi:hypothetical protein